MKIEVPDALLIEVAKVFRDEAEHLDATAYSWFGSARTKMLALAKKNREMAERLIAERLKWKP